jgi:hypothetical protein
MVFHPMIESGTIVVTLVHGTFAVSAPWTGPDSPLRRSLEKRLSGPIVFVPHPWSGWLTQNARRNASAELRDRLLANYLQYPSASHFIIGHSHGGNIALYALDNESEHARLKGVVCLNTPFITAIRRNTQNFVLPFLFALFFLIMSYFGSVVLLTVAISLSDLFGYSSALSFSWSPPSGLSAFRFMVASAVLALVATGSFLLWRRRLAIDTFFQGLRERAVLNISLPRLERTKVLAIWNASDEVHGAFSLLEVLEGLPFLLMHVAVVLVVFSTAFIMALADITAISGYAAFESIVVKWNVDSSVARSVAEGVVRFLVASTWGLFVVFGYLWALIFLGLYLNFLLRIVPIGMSWSRTFDSLFVHLSLSLTPLTVNWTEFRDIALPYRFMNHSSAYSDPSSLELIANWIKQRSDKIHPSQQLLPPAFQ